MSEMYDEMGGEMQCYCDVNKHHPKLECPETISYRNHHDWSSEEDYMCETCLENCLEE